MNLSYWERKTWLNDIDYAVIGSGIVGLSCALSLRKKAPKSKIVVFEKGMLPSGASTENAGFACFGSISEILSDLDSHSEEEVIDLVKNRIEGLRFLRNTLGDEELEYLEYRGYELFTLNDTKLFGGGRNLDLAAEELTNIGLTPLLQNKLEEFLSTTILPNTTFEKNTQWSGTMGVGKQKKPIVKHVSNHIICGVRLGGMGVAIGSSVGRQLANSGIE